MATLPLPPASDAAVAWRDITLALGARPPREGRSVLELAALRELTARLATGIERMPSSIAEQAMHVVAARGAALFVTSPPATRSLRLRARAGAAIAVESGDIDTWAGLARLGAGEPLLLALATPDAATEVLAVGVRGDGRLLGMLVAHADAGAFRNGDAQALDAVAAIAATVAREEALAAERARLTLRDDQWRVITDSVPALLGYLDREERYQVVNATFERWMGVPPEAIVGRTLGEVLGEDVRNILSEHIQAALAGHEVTFEREASVRGARRWMSVTYTPHQDDDGWVRGYIALLYDITERKRMEERLRESESRVRLVADNVPAKISYVDRELVYRFNNAAYSRWYGVGTSDITGRHVREVLGEDTYRERLPYMRRALAGETVRFESPGHHVELGVRSTEITCVPDVDATGTVRGFFVMGVDITEREAAAEALREADRRKDQFLAMLAHELRNPLAPLSNALALWPAVQHDAGRMRALRELMGRQVAQLTRLLDDLLDVSRITRGRIELKREPVGVGEVLHRAVEAVRPLVEAQRHALHVEPAPADLYLHADVARLTQVFANLLNNAARYTAPGGAIRLSCTREGDAAVIRVQDNGTGIPAGMLGRVFEMFVQVDRRLERSHGGLGIGLALSRALVEMHGGSIVARSEGVDRGSELEVRLPLAHVAAPVTAPDDAVLASVSAEQRRRVLVVDDAEASAVTLGDALRAMGHEVEVVTHGAAAVDVARRFAPDVVFLDLAMPGMSGYDVAGELRGHPATRAAMLVALTGFGQEEDYRRTRAAGFDHHLVKPGSIATIQRLLAASRRTR